MFTVELVVRPRAGVRDPQGAAVEESLKGVGYGDVHIHCVGRYLRFVLETDDRIQAEKDVDEMCRRLLVNPNLETYEARIERGS